MPSRAPLTDEEMQLLRDRVERYEAAKSTRTPPPAPSQTFGMRTHSARRTSPRQRYDPEAAAEARHADRMRLAELRKTVLTQQAAEADAKKVKRKKIQDESSVRTGLEEKGAGTGLKSGAFYQPVNYNQKTTVAQDYAAAHPPIERPISSMYSVTPSQYAAAYGVPFTGSDPDSMRRLLALQNGTASVIGSERGVIDQRQTDKDNAAKYANMKPAVGDHSREVKEPGEPGSDYQSRAFMENLIPDGTYAEANRQYAYDNAMEQAGGVPNQGQIDAMDRQREAELERIRRARIFDLNSSSPSERFGIPPTQTMSQMMDPDSPMATGPGRKGLPRGAVPRK